jgi:predicted SprT family Zn-dependent metalloprotease
MEIKKAEMIAKDLMVFHRLENWSFEFDNAVRRFGCCRLLKRIISLSKHLTSMNDEHEVINVVLHEIAHALAPKTAHHGPEWKEIAVSIGCSGDRCYDAAVVARPAPQFMGVCPKCYYTIKRHRRKNISCGRCSKTYDKSRLFVWGKITAA